MNVSEHRNPHMLTLARRNQAARPPAQHSDRNNSFAANGIVTQTGELAIAFVAKRACGSL
jgi:hypothetical protein